MTNKELESLLKACNIGPEQRTQIFDSMKATSSAVSAAADDSSDDRPTVGDVQASLTRHVGDLRHAHNRIIRGLVDDKIVRAGEGFSPLFASASAQEKPAPAPKTMTLMQAAASIPKDREPILRQVLACAKRLGIDLPLDKPIDMFNSIQNFAAKILMTAWPSRETCIDSAASRSKRPHQIGALLAWSLARHSVETM